VRLGDLYERLGNVEDAAAAHRRALSAGGATPHAAWALFHLTARHGDTAAVAEATAGLANSVDDAGFRATCWRRSPGSARATTRPRGSRSSGANRPPPGRRLGKALVAARRNDAGELAAALVPRPTG